MNLGRPADPGTSTGHPATVGVVRGFAAGLAFASLTLLALPWFLSSWADADGGSGVLFWPAGLLAAAPVCWAGWVTRHRWRCAIGVCLGSLPLWAVHHAWVADVSLAGVVPLILYLAIWPGLTALVLSFAAAGSRWAGPALIVPTVWVGIEFLRGELVMGGYAWFLAGHPMIEFLPLARAASVGGVYLVSWLVVAPVGVALAARYGTPVARRVGWAVSCCAIAALVFGAAVQPGGPSGREVVVGAVQTDVPQNNKLMPTREQVVADFNDLLRLIEQASAEGAAFVVLPETVFPGVAIDEPGALAAAEAYGEGINGFRDALLDVQRETGPSMLVGALTRAGLSVVQRDDGAALEWDGVHNSVYLLADGSVTPTRYDKLRPTPFGETLPYVQSLPWLRDLVLRIGLGASGMDFGLDAGATATVFRVPTPSGEVVAATPICFESSMSPVVRRLVRADESVELLVVMTNDGWFGSFDAGRAMHLLQSRWRCVETALPMARSANTGATAVIDRDGRVRRQLPMRSSGVLVEPMTLGGGATVYTALGDVVGWAALGVGSAMGLIGWRNTRGTRRHRVAKIDQSEQESEHAHGSES